MRQLDGKVALVTGGASGMGAATARLFADEGATVAILDLDTDRASEIAAATEGFAVTADVASPQQVDAAVAQVIDRFARVDVLAHFAGVGPDSEWRGRLATALEARRDAMAWGSPVPPLGLTEDLDDDRWRNVLSVDLDGVFYCSRAVLRHMATRRSGALVLVASGAANVGPPGYPHYSAAKAGVLGLMRSLAMEFAPIGIRVNAIAPDATETPSFAVNPPMLREQMTTAVPLGRLARPEEIARTALFLATDQSSHLVGQTLHVNGGVFLAG
jgi:3-oxoacyl-[acyl-carrier protein] reductase